MSVRFKDTQLIIFALLLGVICGSVPTLLVSYSFYFMILIGVIVSIAVLVFFRRYITPVGIKSLPITSDIDKETVNYKFTMFFYGIGTLFLGQLSFRPAGDITISDLCYFSAVGLWFFIIVKNHKIPFYVLTHWLGVGLVLFLIGATLSIFNSVLPIQSLSKVLRLVFIITVWFTLSIKLLNTEQKVFKMLLLWVLSIAFNGLIAVLQLKWEIPLTTNHYGRMSAFTGHVSDLGGMTSVAWIPALMLATTVKSRKSVIYYVLLLLVGLGVILSGSVSGMIAISLGTFIWMFISRPNFKFLFVLFVMATSIVALFLYQEANGYVTPLSRFESTTSLAANDENGTLMSRAVTYQAAFEVIKENPFVGVGYDEISNKTVTGFPVHNLYLAAWFEGGIIALLGMMIMTVTILYLGVYATKNAPSKLHYNLSLGLLISFACALVFGMTAPILYQRYIWMPAALILPLYKLARDYKKKTSK
ncbi:O-antigen ligase family protein [Priestia megaterium]|uniref:O-antigen ligase family protein n=1 Tax=Priestia megaterium TaxID=1404 RepID=UPI001E3D4793|nr:O-antigen ligase family protein [Priestia megaterium]MCE4092868.1 O-antigen ligase family protein [Priestia megaterium]